MYHFETDGVLFWIFKPIFRIYWCFTLFTHVKMLNKISIYYFWIAVQLHHYILYLNFLNEWITNIFKYQILSTKTISKTSIIYIRMKYYQLSWKYTKYLIKNILNLISLKPVVNYKSSNMYFYQAKFKFNHY